MGNLEELPIIAGAISWAGVNIDDNIAAIGGITILLIVAMIFQPFESGDMFALTMSGIAGISALAGYEIGKRKA